VPTETYNSVERLTVSAVTVIARAGHSAEINNSSGSTSKIYPISSRRSKQMPVLIVALLHCLTKASIPSFLGCVEN